MRPLSYLCFRLLGAALPLLSKEQLQLVMQGDLIRHYGEHMVTAKVSAAPRPNPAGKGQVTGLLPAQRRKGISQLLEERVVLGVSGPAWNGQTQLALGGGAGDLGVPHLWVEGAA